MEKTGLRQSRRSGSASSPINIWSVQCDKCFKWRVIPTLDEYEEIRSKVTEDPFVCSKRPGVSCGDPADIECDMSRTWVIDRPNIPKTPPGFKRLVVMRRDFSKMDCYYDTPTGKRLRASTEVVRFLDSNPEYIEQGILPKDFSFQSPRIMEDTIPSNLSKN